MKTPLITPMAAKPKTPLKRIVAKLIAGLKFSCSCLATGTQVPKVIWNMVSIDLGKVPKYSKSFS